MTFDGHQQRKALTALERAVGALAKRDAVTAKRAAGRAAEFDQTGVYAAVPGPIDQIVQHIEAETPVPEDLWNALLNAVGPGPVGAVVEQLRDSSSPG